MDAGEFLVKLWGNPPPGQVLLWTLPQKRSTWYNRLDNVRVGHFAHLDVYTGVGFAPSDTLLKSGQRATADTIAGIAGLWADVDYAGENHAKPGLPPTEEGARELIAEMPAEPTILVHSGHGLQAWWLFNEPWMFGNDIERENARGIISSWQGHMAEIARKRGWAVDATHDLSRLMRLPGTFNNKSDRVPVRVIYSDGPRWGVEELWNKPQKVAPPDIPVVDSFVLNPNAEPPWDKYRALRDNEAKFRKSLDHDRKDLQDQSPSAYDMSLASFAVMAGWSDQEIVDFLVFSRRSNGDDLKLREDYYARTIAKARGPIEQVQAQERLEDGGRSLADLSTLLSNTVGGGRIDILDLVKHLGDPPEYWMKTSVGSITLGAVNNILDQGRFLAAVAGSTNLVLTPCKKAAWAFRAQAILLCCRDVELGEASHLGTEMAHWVETYLDSQIILDDKNIAAEQSLAFRREDGAVLFALNGFKQYLRFNIGEQLSSHKLGQRLRLCGVEPTVVWVVVNGRETSRHCWVYKGSL